MAREFRELNRPLRLGIYGFWGGFLPRISPLIGLLQSQVEVEFVPLSAGAENTDVVLCSIFGGLRPALLADAFTMQYIGEAQGLFPEQLSWGDYQLGFHPDSSDTFWLPHWQYDMLKYDHKTHALTFHDTIRPLIPKTEFCAIYTSRDPNQIRGLILDAVNEYQEVHSYGTWRNNRPSDGARNDQTNRGSLKMATLDRYKYTLAVENTSERYYTTSQLSEAILSNTIPIYWGDPNLRDGPFNPKRILDVTGQAPEVALEQIVMLDNDDSTYQKMLKQPIFSKPVFPHGLAARSDVLLQRILENRA